MEHIEKKFKLEEFITRFPIVYPSIVGNEVVYIDKISILEHTNGNYCAIPLGVNEDVCGRYYNFSDSLNEAYSGSTIPYCEIERWMFEFIDYYALLHSNQCGNSYSSATHYYNSVSEPIYSLLECQELDESHESHGGDGFYKWLMANYFVILDLKREYSIAKEDKVEITMSYSEWVSVLKHIKCELISYPDAYEFCGKMQKLYKKYGEDPTPSDFDDCCECVDYINMGGYDMLKILYNWINKEQTNLEKINSIVKYNEAKLIPSASITVKLSKKIEDFGNFQSIASDFIPGHAYNVGNVCIYEDNVYILVNENSAGYKIEDGIAVFDESSWVSYYSKYMNDHSREKSLYENYYTVSGRTVSSLDSFVRSRGTIDNIGNQMPGYYEPFSGSTFIQPPEGTILDLEYELGKAINVLYLSDNKFNGDLLLSVDVYCVTSGGSQILTSLVHCEEGDSILEAIDDCVEAAKESGERYGDIHCDFTYYKGVDFAYTSDGKAKPITHLIGNYTYTLGVKCVEHCTLSLENYTFYLSSNESYQIKYYNVTRNVEYNKDDDDEEGYNVNMTDFYITPGGYEENDNLATPTFRKEELLGYSLAENTKANIYIDRGYSTVLDKHLRIGEVTSFETLSKYGNGLFNLINLEEESV